MSADTLIVRRKSTAIPNSVIAKAPDPFALTVYVVLAKLADENNTAPAIPDIAHEAKMGETKVRESLLDLAAHNLLRAAPRQDETGRNISSRYILFTEEA